MYPMITFINLFFIPMLSVYIYYKRKKEEAVLSVPLAVRYCIFTVLTFLSAKLECMLVNIFYEIALPPHNAYYTVFAVPAAIILPFIIEFAVKYIGAGIRIEKNTHEK